MYKKGLINIDWQNIDSISDEKITYFLFLEGKNIETICKIRKMDKITVQRQIIEGKIKYRMLSSSKDSGELLKKIINAGKDDKIQFLNNLSDDLREELITFIQNNYYEMNYSERAGAVWIIGELKAVSCLDILIKASVHKSVNIRRMAVSAMGKLEDTAAETALLKSLNDENPQVVLYAVKSLKKINSKAAVEKLKILASVSDKAYIINACKEYFAALE